MSLANPREPFSDTSLSLEDLGILLFARAPVTGRCKTRLAATLGPCRAMRIYRAMLARAAALAQARAPGRVTLVCAPDTQHPMLAALARRHGLRRLRQCSGDLGRRMHCALAAGLARHRAVILMGSDQPTLDDAWLVDAAHALARPNSAWLAPTRDGGYWAIGLRQTEARLFQGIRWSTRHVARQTNQRMRRCGLEMTAYPTRQDIDDGRDWDQLAPALQARLSRSAAMPGVATENELTGFRAARR